MTLGELNSEVVRTLVGALGAGEGKAAARIVMEDCAGFTPVKVLLNPGLELEPETPVRVRRVLARVVEGYPVQYAVGSTVWMGMKLEVTPDTLIPRPETAGLVDMIKDDMGNRPDLRVLDAGTGSGCIAIALSRALPFSEVTAVDISDGALAVARRNAAALHAAVTFVRGDILKMPLPSAPLYDLIVSNPPYIAEGAADTVDKSVDAYEPASALYVPDSDPLMFYRAIGQYGLAALKSGGRLYFEINPDYATGLSELLHAQGYTDVEVLRDFYGRERYARAILYRP